MFEAVLLGPAAGGGVVVALPEFVEAAGGVVVAAGVAVGVAVGDGGVGAADAGAGPVGVVGVGGFHSSDGVDEPEGRPESIGVVVELAAGSAFGDEGSGGVAFVVGAGPTGGGGEQSLDAAGVVGGPEGQPVTLAVAAVGRRDRALPGGGEAGGLIGTVVAVGGQGCGAGLVAVDVVGGGVAGELVDTVVGVRCGCRAVDAAGALEGAVAVGVVAVAVGHR